MRLSILAAAIALLVACDPTVTDTEADTEASGEWFATCGAPVCNGYNGPFPGVPLCSDQVIGDSCDGLGETCDPEDACDALVQCATEDPTQLPGGCPRSRAVYKTDITYLSASEQQAALQWLNDTRLATWRYTEQASDERVHMGFIIDDQPNSAAVRPDGEHVDLYGYTSLAVAAMQAQQAEIETLKAEMAALRAELHASRD